MKSDFQSAFGEEIVCFVNTKLGRRENTKCETRRFCCYYNAVLSYCADHIGESYFSAAQSGCGEPILKGNLYHCAKKERFQYKVQNWEGAR